MRDYTPEYFQGLWGDRNTANFDETPEYFQGLWGDRNTANFDSVHSAGTDTVWQQ